MKNVNVLLFIAMLSIVFLSGTVRSQLHPPSNGTESVKHAVVPKCIFGANSVQFFAYTREIPEGVVLHHNATSDQIQSVFKTGRRCVGGAHGFLAEANQTEHLEVYHRWLEVENVNIVAVNWAQGACRDGLKITSPLGYGKAAKNSQAVGFRFAKFLLRLVEEDICIVEDLRAFGHSLGAHVIGFTGKRIFQLTGKKLKMLIGCDPARPGFEHNDCDNRLCMTDAQYVEAIHTSVLGIKIPVGTVDFVVNTNKLTQPGCYIPTCSHSRSLQLLRDSLLSNCSLVGTQSPGDSLSDCTTFTCNKVGFNAPQYRATGVLYVEVNRTKAPFCNYYE